MREKSVGMAQINLIDLDDKTNGMPLAEAVRPRQSIKNDLNLTEKLAPQKRPLVPGINPSKSVNSSVPSTIKKKRPTTEEHSYPVEEQKDT